MRAAMMVRRTLIAVRATFTRAGPWEGGEVGIGRRGGTSLLELVFALVLLGLLLSAAVGLFAAQNRLAVHQRERAAWADAARTVFAILPAETRDLVPRLDVHAADGDSLTARLFRGAGLACGEDADGLLVRYRGMRDPDPDKDSVLVVPAGDEYTLALTAWEPASSDPADVACAPGPGEELQHWVLAGPPPPAAAVLLFETGSYYLSSKALRYRRGAEGRQPITAELFRDAGTSMDLDAAGVLEVRLVPAPARAAERLPSARLRAVAANGFPPFRP